MITKPTTFVLGAGASSDYGLPLGSGLIPAIADQVSVPDGRYKNVAEWTGVSAERLKTFVDKIKGSEVPSIDSWLARRPDFIDIGRMAIARVIHEHESIQEPNAGWYSVLWRKMQDRCGSLAEFVEKNKVSFVTFNYDRSLEQFFSRKTQDLFHDGETSPELLEKMRVIHIHGRAGRLGWHHSQGGDVEPEVPYGNLRGMTRANWDFAKACSSRFRVIGSAQDDAELAAIDAARMVMHQSDRIIFLGFGFHSDNVAKIKMDRTKTKAVVEIAVHKSHPIDRMQTYGTSTTSPLGKEAAITKIDNLKEYLERITQRLN